MTSIARRLILAGFVGCVLVVWGAQSDDDGVGAQQRAPLVVTRMYTGPDGRSHFEDISGTLMPGGNSSEILQATSYRLQRTAPGVNDWHPGPRRQYVIQLSGRREVEVDGGRKVTLNPGSVLLVEDLTGKGHITRTLGPEDTVFLAVHLP